MSDNKDQSNDKKEKIEADFKEADSIEESEDVISNLSDTGLGNTDLGDTDIDKFDIDEQKIQFDHEPIPRMNTLKSKQKVSIVTLIMIIFVLLLSAGIAWVAYEQYQAKKNWIKLEKEIKKELNEHLKVTQNTIKEIQDEIAISKNLAQKNQILVNQYIDNNAQLNQSLLATQEKIRQLSGRRQEDWILAEVEYLIKLASLSINLKKDKKSALILLKNADEKISKIADNSLLSLRQVIAEDIAQLEVVELIDVSGIASELNAISLQVPQLSLIASEFKPTDNKKEKNNASSWSQAYRNLLNDFVVITDHDTPIRPLMSLKQRTNLNANIQLALQQAQIAVLHYDQSLYNLHIKNSVSWITEFFIHNQISKVTLKKLENLASQKINPQFPEVLKSEINIQAINKERLYQWLQNDSTITPNNSNNHSELDNSVHMALDNKETSL